MSELGSPKCRPQLVQAAPGGASGLRQALVIWWAGAHRDQSRDPSSQPRSQRPWGLEAQQPAALPLTLPLQGPGLWPLPVTSWGQWPLAAEVRL